MNKIIHNAFIMLMAMGFLMTVPALGQSGGEYNLTWSSKINGGGQSAGGQYNLTGTVGQPDASYSESGNIDSGGGQSAGGQYNLTGTVGQPDANYSESGNYELLGNFWPGGPLCFVDFEQYNTFVKYWLETGNNLPADLNGDGVVDICDLTIFIDEWLCVCSYNWPLR
jgi:hypothetical protein